MKVIYVGGETVGLVGLTATLVNDTVCLVVSYHNKVRTLVSSLGIYSRFNNIKDLLDYGCWENVDVLMCVGGREKIPKEILDKIPCINIHPYWDKYKGANPIGRAIEDGVDDCMVASHYMTEEYDVGELIHSVRVKTTGKTTGEVYRQLYPVYYTVVYETLNMIRGSN